MDVYTPRQNYSSLAFLIITLLMIVPTIVYPTVAHAKPIGFIDAQQTDVPTTSAGQTNDYRFDSGALIFVPRLVQEALDAANLSAACTFVGRAAVETIQIGGVKYAGAYAIWDECTFTDSVYGVLSLAQQGDDTFLLIVGADMVDMVDVESLAAVLADSLDQTVTIPFEGLEPITAEVNEQINQIIASGDIRPQEDEPVMTIATVLAVGLDVRSGPGANFERIGFANEDMNIEVVAQVDNCRWLQVRNTNGDLGWISGSNELVALNNGCETIPKSQK